MVALLAQLCPAPAAPIANAARAAHTIGEYPEADLAVFPELFVSGYRLDHLDQVAVEIDGPELGFVARAAAEAGTAAIVGFVERSGRDFYNAVACFDEQGELAGVYRKLKLFGEETAAFLPGRRMLLVELAGRTVVPMVCFDMEFPELARAAALAGADLFVTVAANMEPYGREHRVHALARALENRIPHLYLNRVGQESGFAFTGETCSIDADGVVLAQADGREERFLLAEVGRAGATDTRVEYLAFEPSRPSVEVQAKSHSRGGAR
ncbi:MAG TPA: nitrilase-related carbon-nitrogen hydrolase [Solirubrobacterales bacterium]|nr:nitrilase-related carbon-nitrogen hydrolase [Solirubrobacterales bacterium]